MKHVYRLSVAIAVCAVALCAGLTSSAAAAPAPGFENFAGCPETTGVLGCIRSETNAGHIQMGSKDVPINKQIVLSGGLATDFTTLVYNSKGGLNAPPLKIPGGLTGLTGLSEFILNLITFGANDVYAKTELVGTAKAVGIVQLVLPVRIKLQNPFLSSDCSIGTSSNPVLLNLTTGTTSPPLPNKPISGKLGPQGTDPKNPLVFLAADNTYVDNSFAAPAVNNCGLFSWGPINSLVNSISGLPSPAGKNTAVLSDTDVRLTGWENVYP